MVHQALGGGGPSRLRVERPPPGSAGVTRDVLLGERPVPRASDFHTSNRHATCRLREGREAGVTGGGGGDGVRGARSLWAVPCLAGSQRSGAT